jgi:hypothetical protein
MYILEWETTIKKIGYKSTAVSSVANYSLVLDDVFAVRSESNSSSKIRYCSHLCLLFM